MAERVELRSGSSASALPETQPASQGDDGGDEVAGRTLDGGPYGQGPRDPPEGGSEALCRETGGQRSREADSVQLCVCLHSDYGAICNTLTRQRDN